MNLKVKTTKGQDTIVTSDEHYVTLAINSIFPVKHIIALRKIFEANPNKDFHLDKRTSLAFSTTTMLEIITELEKETGYVHNEKEVSVKY